MNSWLALTTLLVYSEGMKMTAEEAIAKDDQRKNEVSQT
jgi:hypothetical protein